MTPIETLLHATTLDADARSLLEWFKPPSNLQAFGLVLQGMELLLPVLREVAGTDEVLEALSPATVESLQAGLENVREQELTLAAIDDPKMHWGRDRKSPFFGITETNPLYVAIGTLSLVEPPASRSILILTAVVVGVIKQLQEIKRPGVDYRSASRNALDSARLFPGLSLIPALPSGFEDLDSYLTALDQLIENAAAQKRELNHPVSIARAIRFLITRTGGRRRGGQILTDERWSLQSNVANSVRVQRVANVSPDERRKIRLSGLSIDEFADDVEYVDLDREAEDDGETPEGQDHESSDDVTSTPPDLPPPSQKAQVMRRINMIGQIERGAQMLPCSWDRLVPFEVAAVQREIELALTMHPMMTSENVTTNQLLDLESRTLVGAMLWLGRTFQEAITLKLYARDADLPRALPNHSVALVRDSGMAYWPVIRPKASPTYKGADLSLARQVSDRVVFPIPAELYWCVTLLPTWQRLRSFEKPNGPTSLDGFASPADQLQHSVNALRKRVAATGGSRITLKRIAGTMFQNVAALSGDLVQASLALGKQHRLSDTGLHYENIRLDQLTAVLVTTSSQLSDDVALELARPRPYCPAMTTSSLNLPAYAGSPICPLDFTIADSVETLRRALKDEQQEVLVEDYWVTLHNAFAMYMHFMLRMAIGLRDVGEPLPSWRHINLERRIIFISDKDDVAGYSSRILPLPDLVCEQLQSWKAHVDSMRSHLMFERYAHTTRAVRIREGVLHYWYRTESGQLPPVTSTYPWIRERLSAYLPKFELPLNCNRHYLRSRLLELGVPPEIVDAFMGHWRRGQEPWGRYSMLPSSVVLDILRPAIEQVLNDLGFKVVRGWA